ncbi:MAG TPA: pitrilysin family protein [Candidatus Paceibacterota bacterium]|nr:pitrilysin family protein [Candidatus Paceibacterota bacterium]
MYSKQIQEKTFTRGTLEGAALLVTYFPTKGLVSFVGSIKGGSRGWGSSELAHVHAAMLLEGTAKHSKKEIQQILDSIAAILSFAVSDEQLVFSGRVRTVHLSRLLALIAECLTLPTFPDAELEVLKQREISNLTLASQDTRQQAGILLTRVLYTAGHPNYEETTEESKKVLSKITGDFLRSRHAAMVDKRTLIVSIAGDITMAKATAIMEKNFTSLTKTNFIFLPYKKGQTLTGQKVQTIIPNKASIDYMIGAYTGLTKASKEYAALLLGMQILGNRGFSSRLMTAVREQEGLTYGVYGYLAGFENAADGYLYIWATFAPQLFQKGRSSIMNQIRLIIDGGVTEEEVKKHSELYNARAKVQLSNSAAFAATAQAVIADGLPLSHLDDFPKKILKLTASEVNETLKKYLVPEHMSESAAGPVEKNVLTR